MHGGYDRLPRFDHNHIEVVGRLWVSHPRKGGLPASDARLVFTILLRKGRAIIVAHRAFGNESFREASIRIGVPSLWNRGFRRARFLRAAGILLGSFFGKSAEEAIGDLDWLQGEFFTTVQKRGAAIIAARGLSSAMSAANGLVDHVRDLRFGCDGIRSMCVPSDGSYGVTEGLISSFPVRCTGNNAYEIVQGLELDDFLRGRLAATVAELAGEKDVVADLLGANA